MAINLESMTSRDKSVGRDSLSKLFKDGVLRDGDELHWKRKVEHFKALVIEGGLIVTSDGVKHKTPSGAAKHLVGRSVDGWIVWRSARHGKSLHELRRPI